MLGTDLAPYLRDVSVIVHLAAAIGPLPDDELFTRVNVDGTRRVLDAATVDRCEEVVRPSSTAVYGAWANNPVPITEDAPLRPSPGYLPAIVDGECERLLAQWAGAASRPSRDPAADRPDRRGRRALAAHCGRDRSRAGTRPRRDAAGADRARRRRRRRARR